MATYESTNWSTTDWPASKLLAVIGGVIGLVAGLLVIAGVGVSMLNVGPTYGGTLFGLGLVAVGVVDVVLAILVFVSAGMLNENPRVHGGLLVLWGLLGLVFAFGVWMGAILVILGGVLGYMQAMPTRPMTRRPVT